MAEDPVNHLAGFAMVKVNHLFLYAKGFVLLPVEGFKSLIEFLNKRFAESLHAKGFAFLVMERVNQTLPHMKSSANFALEKVHQTIPYAKGFTDSARKTVDHLVPHVNVFAGFVKERFDEAFPHVKSFLMLVVEKAKDHPYVCGFSVLISWWVFRSGFGSGKMMKAPGRNYRMPRSRFESNPRSYFRNLRKKSRFWMWVLGLTLGLSVLVLCHEQQTKGKALT